MSSPRSKRSLAELEAQAEVSVEKMSAFWKQPKYSKGQSRLPYTLSEAKPFLRSAAQCAIKHTCPLPAGSTARAHRYLHGAFDRQGDMLKEIPEAFVTGLSAALLGCRTDALENFVTPDAVGSVDAERASEMLTSEASLIAELSEALRALAGNADALREMEAAAKDAENRADRELDVFGVDAEPTLAEHLRNIKRAREALERAVAEAKARAEPENTLSMGAVPEGPSVINKHGAPASRVPEYLESASGLALERSESQKIAVKLVEQVSQGLDKTKSEIASLQGMVSDLPDPDDPEHAKEALATVGKLQYKCRFFTEQLMQDLLKLDGVTLKSEEDKPRRKTQVKNIQALIDQVDAISTQLQPLHNDLQERVAQQEQEAAALEQQRREREEKQAQLEALREQERVEKLSSEIVARVPELKLQPKFDVSKARDPMGGLNYVVSSSLVGLDWDGCQVEASEDQESLSISGSCTPSQGEVARMVASVPHYRSRMSKAMSDSMDDAQVVLHVLAGQFGSFAEHFRLPAAAQVSLISSDYSGSTLSVTIPTQYGGRAQSARARGAPRGFFGDRDFFW